MKDFKGTKGKWLEKYSNCTTQIKCGERLICEVYHNFEVNNDDESEYNAKLIASAPELLEALQHGLRLAESLKNKDSIAVRMFIKSAQQAINKALGYD